jgi:hypothetical protein
MITKNDIPLDMLKAIEGIAQKNLDLIKLQKLDNTYYSFVQVDENSENYFRIYIDGKKVIANPGNSGYVFSRKPASSATNKKTTSTSDLNGIVSEFNKWIELIKEISELVSLHDDNFVKKYQEYYFAQFIIIDEDAFTSPFDPEQQIVIEHFLDSLSEQIEKTEMLESNLKEELSSEVMIIKRILTHSTKNEVMKKLSKVYGILYKHSKNLAYDIMKATKKGLIKKLVSLGIKYGTALLGM